MERLLAMNRLAPPDGKPRFPRARTQRQCGSFTLVELLVVMAIMAILLLLAVPAITSLLEGDNLNAGAQQVADQINLARQLSSSQNITVELRLFKLAGATASGYTVIQLGTNNSAGTWLAATRPATLPQNIAVSESKRLSAAFLAFTNTPPTVPATMPSTGYGVVSSATYYPFEFRPSGIITPIVNATSIKNMTNYCLTVVPARFAASTYTTLGSPIKNYAVVQINPVTATPLIYRP